MDPLLAVDPGVVELCINHIALPPKLPGRSDTRTDEVDDFLIRYLLRGIKSITQLVSPDQFQLWDKLRIVIQDARELNRGGIIESGRLLRQLQALGDGKFLILKVSEQNAGVLIRGDFGYVQQS